MPVQGGFRVAAGEVSDEPLNVAVRGDEVLILGPGGEDIVLTARAAQRSAQRLLDAVAVASGHLPSETPAPRQA
jgi:hypothetical protein